MKEMVYKPLHNIFPEILHEGEYQGRKFCIISAGTHPTAYVSLTAEETTRSKKYSDYCLNVHGGATFLGTPYWRKEKTRYIGWDYAHYGDFTYLNIGTGSNFTGRMWTTEEIFDEVKSAIDQLNSGEVLQAIS